MAAYFDEKTKTWYIKFRYTDWQGNAKTTTRRGFKTKKEARSAEMRIKEEASLEPSMTVQELYDIYIEDFRQRHKDSSYRQRRSTFVLHVLPYVGNVRLDSLKPNTIRRWQNELDGLAESSKRVINVNFSIMLNFAVKYYGLKQNPFTITGYTGKHKMREAFWELAEFKKACEYMRPHIRLIAEVLFYSGMRVGEMMALSPADIDYKKNTITVNKTYAMSTGAITPPKTPTSNRVISMPPKIIEAIERALSPLKQDLPERVFGITYNAIKYNIQKAAKDAGVPVINIHGLRHSHASYCIRENVSIVALSKRLGHSSVDITLHTYSHMYKEDDSEIAAMLDKTI